MDTQTTGAKPAVKSTFRRQPPKPLATTRCSASCDRETPRLPGLDPQASLRIHHPQPPQQPMPMQPSLRGRRPGILALPQIRADRPSKQQEHAAQARATHAVASAGDRIRHPRTSTHHRPPSHADGAARALRAPVPCTSTDLQQLHPRILAMPDRRQLHPPLRRPADAQAPRPPPRLPPTASTGHRPQQQQPASSGIDGDTGARGKATAARPQPSTAACAHRPPPLEIHPGSAEARAWEDGPAAADAVRALPGGGAARGGGGRWPAPEALSSARSWESDAGAF
nr:uncharacterized protein D806_0078 [Aegilops tauschii subsp. strangulata]